MSKFLLFCVTLSLFLGTLSAVAGTDTRDELDQNNKQAVDILNRMRQERDLPAVVADRALAERCYAWSKRMNDRGWLGHDRTVYGTDERENVAGAAGYPLTVKESMQMWEDSPGHAASMFDRRGFPTAFRAGYAQIEGFSCLRICPKQRSGGEPCSLKFTRRK